MLKSAKFIFLAMSVLLFSNSVVAQIEEIIVVARKIQENLQDVPIAVSAFTGETLIDIGLTNFAEVGDLVPNVQIDRISPINGSSNTPNINIRGIGTTDFLLTIDPSVGVYVDGVYVARSVGGLFDLLDLEQVEVLRGPQGTLFGRNTVGGAVQLVSRKPNEEFRVSAGITTGDYNRIDVRASISGALSDNFFASIAVSRKERDGYGKFRDFFADHPEYAGLESAIAGITAFDEATATLLSGNQTGLPPGSLIAGGNIVATPGAGDRPGNENNHSGRVNLIWNASDKFSFSFVADFSSADETSPALVLVNIFADDLSQPTPGVVNPITGNEFAPNLVALHTLFGFEAATVPYDNATFLIDDVFSTYGTGPGASESDVWGLSLTADYAISEAYSFKSITAYRELDALFGQDPDHSPFTMDAHTNDYTHEQFSQEFQLIGSRDRFSDVIGVYLFDEKGTDRVIVPLLHGLAALDEANTIDNSSWAVFAQGTYDINGKTSVTAGVRYTDEKKFYDQVHLDCGIANALGVPSGFVVNNCNSLSTGTAKLDISNTTWSLNLSHRWNDNYMGYASFSTGFKSGGFSGRTTAFVPDQTPIPFDEETASTFELGFKTDFDKARINFALFSTNFDDLQLTVQSGVAPITKNAAAARIRGIEIEILFAPTERLNINAAIGFLDAEYKSPPPFPIGPELANAPEFSAYAGFDYYFPLSSLGDLILRGDLNHKSKIFNNAENTLELIQPSTTFVNASLTWNLSNEHVSVVLGGRNLTNNKSIITGFFQPGVGYTEAVHSRPREWYLSVNLEY